MQTGRRFCCGALMPAFEKAFAIVIGIEGGYSNNPNDAGGETKYGISKRAYPNLDIRNLTLEAARGIYKKDYWDRVRGDLLPAPMALIVFDAAVNSGVGQAIKWLQEAVGAHADGVIGPVTLAAVQAHSGRGAALIAEYMAQRNVFLAGLPSWRSFSLGWSRRMAALPFHAISMEQV